MKYTIPNTMKALLQQEAGGKLMLKEVPVPQPQKGEVLVKMSHSPINPSDLSFLQGTYISKPNYPVIPGLEGSGTVVASGAGVLSQLRLGKRVTCSSTEGHGGTWAEYMVTSAMRVIPVSKEITMKEASMLIVNPMTALAFLSIAKTYKQKAIVNNAASSALGKMLIKLCQRENLALISVVRNEKHVQRLKELGAKYVLNSTNADFEQKLKQLMHDLDARLIFDAVAGLETERLLRAAPEGAKLILYANLSEQKVNIDSRVLVQSGKSIEGFYLGGWAAQRNLFQTLRAAKQAQRLIATDLSSNINRTFKLNEANEAVRLYKQAMSQGKVLFEMND